MLKSMDVRLRPATTDDIPALEALIESSVRGLQANDYPASQIDASIGSAFGVDRQLLADHTYFVAEDAAGALVAAGGWSFRKTLCGSDCLSHRDSGRLDPAHEYAKIRAIFVHPGHARQGLGSQILAHCEAAAQAAGFTRFEMGSTRTGVPLYTLRGYIERERLGVPLPNGELLEVIRMTKQLPGPQPQERAARAAGSFS